MGILDTLYGISADFGWGGKNLVPDGQSPNLRDELRSLKASIHAPVADATALAAITALNRADGMKVVKLDDGSEWTFDADSSAGASASVVVPAAGTGRWLKNATAASLAATTGAAAVGIADAGTFTAETTVEGALQEIYQDLKSGLGVIELRPSDFYLLTGAPLAVFADGDSAVPGSALVDSKAFGVRWNNHGTPNAIATSFQIPPDADITANMVLHLRASKTGATVGDAVTFAVEAYNQVAAALHDADANFGGTSGAMTGNSTAKTIQNVTLTLALANLAAYPASVTLSIKPTAGTLGTDDLVFHGARIVYQKKLLTS